MSQHHYRNRIRADPSARVLLLYGYRFCLGMDHLLHLVCCLRLVSLDYRRQHRPHQRWQGLQALHMGRPRQLTVVAYYSYHECRLSLA